MKLFYSKGACSLAPIILADWLGLELDIERVNLKDPGVDREEFFRPALFQVDDAARQGTDHRRVSGQNAEGAFRARRRKGFNVSFKDFSVGRNYCEIKRHIVTSRQ